MKFENKLERYNDGLKCWLKIIKIKRMMLSTIKLFKCGMICSIAEEYNEKSEDWVRTPVELVTFAYTQYNESISSTPSRE